MNFRRPFPGISTWPEKERRYGTKSESEPPPVPEVGRRQQRSSGRRRFSMFRERRRQEKGNLPPSSTSPGATDARTGIVPACVSACKKIKAGKLPEPADPIPVPFPTRKVEDWSKKKEVIEPPDPLQPDLCPEGGSGCGRRHGSRPSSSPGGACTATTRPAPPSALSPRTTSSKTGPSSSIRTPVSAAPSARRSAPGRSPSASRASGSISRCCRRSWETGSW